MYLNEYRLSCEFDCNDFDSSCISRYDNDVDFFEKSQSDNEDLNSECENHNGDQENSSNPKCQSPSESLGLQNNLSDDGNNAISADDNKLNLELIKKYEQVLIELQKTNSALKEDIEKLQSENDQLKKTLLTSYADTDNLRKRFEREKDDAFKYSIAKFAKDLLTIVDNFQRAQMTVPSETDENGLALTLEKFTNNKEFLKAYLDGISLTQKQLLQMLSAYKVNKIEVNLGDKLNPDLHQVMCEIESDEFEKGQIVQVLQDGFVIENRLLRPSMVGVAK